MYIDLCDLTWDLVILTWFCLQGVVHACQDVKERSRRLVDDYGWDVRDSRRIWCFGPEGRGPCLLVDTTKGQQGLQDIKDTVVAGFQWAMQEVSECVSE